MRTIAERVSAAISSFCSVNPNEVETFYDEEIGKWVSGYGLVTILSERGLSTVFVIARCKEMAGYSRVRTDINSTSVHMLTRTLTEASKRAKRGAHLASMLIQSGFDVYGESGGVSGEVRVSRRTPLFSEITIRPGKHLSHWELADDVNPLSWEKLPLLGDVVRAMDSLGVPRSFGEEKKP